MQITRVSQITGHIHTREIEVTEEQLLDYSRGMLLQEAFPDLSADDREFIKTGITPEEWLKYFGEG